MKWKGRDGANLANGKRMFMSGKFRKAKKQLSKLAEKCAGGVCEGCDYGTYADVMFSQQMACNVLGEESGYEEEISRIMEEGNQKRLGREQRAFCRGAWATMCLRRGDYEGAHAYVGELNTVRCEGRGVTPESRGFFAKGDVGKMLLVYDNGGLGDSFMLLRFVRELCEEQRENEVRLMVMDCTHWIFRQAFEGIENLTIFKQSENRRATEHFDYHCNYLSLMGFLGLGAGDIPFRPYLARLESRASERTREIVEEIKSKGGRSYIFNWRGNPKNAAEKHNRSCGVEEGAELFELEGINWVCVTKGAEEGERRFLEEHGVMCVGEEIDCGGNCFEDSIHVMRAVDGVVSTDTSIVHLCATMGLEVHVMLTKGNEWRWWNAGKWYPRARVHRQTRLKEWGPVVRSVASAIAGESRAK